MLRSISLIRWRNSKEEPGESSGSMMKLQDRRSAGIDLMFILYNVASTIAHFVAFKV